MVSPMSLRVVCNSGLAVPLVLLLFCLIKTLYLKNYVHDHMYNRERERIIHRVCRWLLLDIA